MITWLRYYKLKPLQPFFSRCKNDCSIVHAFLSNKHYQSCSKSPHKKRTKGNFRPEKLIQISPARTVTICAMHKSDNCFCTSLDTLGEINFRSKLHLKTSNFFVWKLLFRQKNKVKGRGQSHFKNFWSGEQYNLQHGCYRH